VGRDVVLKVDKKPATPGEVVLDITDVTVVDERNQKVLDDVSLRVKSGEIVAIAGVQGNGQTELAETLLGLRIAQSGTIVLAGEDITDDPVRAVLDKGVGFIPEDRKKDGLVGTFTLEENFMINGSYGPPWVKGVSIDFPAREARSKELIASYDVRTPSAKTLATKLSGGNQQKVVVAREMSRDLTLLVAAQPTRGVDVGSIQFIHEQIVAVRDSGVPVVIISTELDEVLALADRIAVMYRGRIVDIVGPETPREVLGQLMAGIRVTEEVAG
jgi:general nucleoside transport system ATP-binding protein